MESYKNRESVQQLFLKDGHFNLLFIYSFEYAYTAEFILKTL